MLGVRHLWITALLLCPALGCGTVRGGHYCGTDTVGSVEGTGVPAVPDSSFDDEPTQWTLQDYATIDASQSCDLEHSLRLQLDEGIGPDAVTRSGDLENIETGKQYHISFYYRYDHCQDALFVFKSGNYEEDLKVSGAKPDWVELGFDVSYSSLPVWIEVRPTRIGNATDFMGDQYKNNVLWVDDFHIDPI